jgi:hypothetical protein
MGKKTSSGSGTVPGARRRLLHVQSAGFERSAKRDPCALDPLVEEESNDPWPEPRSHRSRSRFGGTGPGVGEESGLVAALAGALWLVPQTTGPRRGEICAPSPDPAPIGVRADGKVDEAAPALPVSAPAPVGAEPAAAGTVESPSEGFVSLGGMAVVRLLEVVPCEELLMMPDTDGRRVSVSAVANESSPPIPKMSFSAVVAARFSVTEITGWVIVETEVRTGRTTSVAAATTGSRVVTTGWATSVAVAITGCIAATTG